jgi:hypothetical protein
MAVNDSQQFISALVPTRLREELSRSARLHDRSLSAEIRTALRQHLRVEAPGVPSSFRPESPASTAGPVKAGAVEPPLRAGPEEDAA